MESQRIIEKSVDPQLEEEIKFMLNNKMITEDEADFFV